MNEEKREKALQEVKMYQSNDWDLKEETPEYFLLERNKQSILIHLLLALFFWWLLFIPNVVYYLINKKTKKIIK